mmetsp:Transcript_29383/g.68441  ORF Transcript_29383/g.68441 Transcript_29383/m.68441 type:complete len:462 (+) Transcript_29383:126-1511(+)
MDRLLGDSIEQDDFGEAVEQALSWFEGRSRSKLCKHHAPSSNARYQMRRRLFLDFRQLVITSGIHVDSMVDKIKARLPKDVPIHLSLRCCQIEDDDALESLKRFLSKVPNLTFISTTFLWFDYGDISDVVSASWHLRELEVPLAYKPGISSVLEACGGRLSDLRFFSGASNLSLQVLDEAMTALGASCRNLKSLGFTSFLCDDDCLEYLLTQLVEWSKCSDSRLEQLQISCDGGTIAGSALPFFTFLIRELADSVKLKLRIANVPLFQQASESHVGDFFFALQQSTTIAKIELEDVGLTGFGANLLFASLENLSSSSVYIAVQEGGIFDERWLFKKLMKSIHHMESVSCLSIIDRDGNGDMGADECAEDVAKSVQRNSSLRHLTLRNGPDYLCSPWLDEMFDRNESIGKAEQAIVSDASKVELPLGLWAPLLACLQAEAGHFEADPTFLILQHLMSSGRPS